MDDMMAAPHARRKAALARLAESIVALLGAHGQEAREIRALVRQHGDEIAARLSRSLAAVASARPRPRGRARRVPRRPAGRTRRVARIACDGPEPPPAPGGRP
jgi:hypothetical protein